MPLLIDALRVGNEHDGRKKISDEQKADVLRLYNNKRESINQIARTVGISKRSVQFILFPERLAVVKARAIEVKRWEPYNAKEIHTPAMQKHRAKKQELFKLGFIKLNNNL